MKKSHLLLLLTGFSFFWGCQEDIPLLGEGQNLSKSKVFIRSITLRSFPENDPGTTLPWDDGSVQFFDTLDSKGPDIYFSFYYKSEELPPLVFDQPTHFSNVLTLHPDTPLIYILTEPFQIPPEYIDTTFYLKINDLDFADPLNTTTIMDSVPFAIGPDSSLADYYITAIDGIGVNGSHVTLGLEWK